LQIVDGSVKHWLSFRSAATVVALSFDWLSKAMLSPEYPRRGLRRAPKEFHEIGGGRVPANGGFICQWYFNQGAHTN
jgi:hypothetical protein